MWKDCKYINRESVNAQTVISLRQTVSFNSAESCSHARLMFVSHETSRLHTTKTRPTLKKSLKQDFNELFSKTLHNIASQCDTNTLLRAADPSGKRTLFELSWIRRRRTFIVIVYNEITYWCPSCTQLDTLNLLIYNYYKYISINIWLMWMRK